MNNKSNRIYIRDLQFDYSSWLEGIFKYQTELNGLRKDLDTRFFNSNRSKGKDFAKKYLIQFNTQNRLMNRIKHDIEVKQDITGQFVSEHLVGDDHILIEDHFSLRDEYAQLGFLFNKLKKEFFLFISAYS
jgi:hypothetical protein